MKHTKHVCGLFLMTLICFSGSAFKLSKANNWSRNNNIFPDTALISKRPPVKKRTFESKEIESVIVKTKQKLKDKEIAWLFENCFPNTLDGTVFYKEVNERPETHIITGDINAMWLRDASCQVWPYLQFAKNDIKLKKMLIGVINREVDLVLIDPYANAFKKDSSEISPWIHDKTDMKPELHERKWEINSLLFVIRLSYGYWKQVGDNIPFDNRWVKAMHLIVQTLNEQQRLNSRGPYHFQRTSFYANEAIADDGYGRPTRKNGMIHATHRQDDATIFPLYVPDNLMAVLELKHLSEMLVKIKKDTLIAKKAIEMSVQIDKAIKKDAIITHPVFGKMYAFEIDGFGSQVLMEESTLPSLLSLPYMGICKKDDPIYQNTRRFVLSDWDPMFAKGKEGEGVGSSHYAPGGIWPLSIINRIMTTDDDKEIIYCLAQLKRSSVGTGFIHESFNKDDATKYTRPWFAWVNTYFGEMILDLLKRKPYLLEK